MSKIAGYSVYQNNYYDNKTQNKKTKETKDADKTKKTDKNNQVNLSSRAKELLEELKKTYGNMDFIVADYDSDEEASAYLSRGTKEYSVLIEPETLEKMAADEKTKDKYLGILDDAKTNLNNIKEQLGDKKDEVKSIGITIKDDGTVSYFAELEKMNEKQRERIEKAREEKKESKKETEKDEMPPVHERYKKTKVQAGSVEELLEKIKDVDWNEVKEEELFKTGSRFDLSI